MHDDRGLIIGGPLRYLPDLGRAVEEATCVVASVHEDEGEARRRARCQVASCGTTRTFQQVIELNGEGLLTGRCRDVMPHGGLKARGQAILTTVSTGTRWPQSPRGSLDRLVPGRGVVDHLTVNTVIARVQLVKSTMTVTGAPRSEDPA